jgi:uncharacterized membrane protein
VNSRTARWSAGLRPGEWTPKQVTLGIWWGILIAVALYYIRRDVPQYVEYTQASYGEYWTRPRSIIVHVFPATMAFLLGFSQFSQRLRSRHPRLHRIAGRFYVASTIIAAPGAMVLGIQSSCALCRPPLVVLAALWLVTTCIAFVAIRLNDVGVHRAFMIRSFALMNVFSLIRLTEPLTFGLTTLESRIIREWSCMEVSIAMARPVNPLRCSSYSPPISSR